jgi:hypothetical protein
VIGVQFILDGVGPVLVELMRQAAG